MSQAVAGVSVGPRREREFFGLCSGKLGSKLQEVEWGVVAWETELFPWPTSGWDFRNL